MSNNAIGSVLVIPEGLVKDLEETDKKIAKIQETSRETAKVFNQSFASMNTSVGTLGSSLDQIITKLNAIAGGATAASGATRSISGGMTETTKTADKLGNSITGVIESINRMYAAQKSNYREWANINSQISELTSRQNTLNSTIKNYQMILDNIKSGKGGNITTAQIEEMKAARQEYDANVQLISQLRQKQLQITTNNQELQRQINILQQLRSASKGSLADDRSADILKRMSEYYKELEKSSAREEKARQRAAAQAERQREREAQAAERAAVREAQAAEKAAAREERARQRANAAKISGYKQQNYARNTTVEGALSFAENANTINRRARAVEYLTVARAKLNTTDAQGRVQLEQLNAKIKELNTANRQAIASSQELNNAHSKLMDTAGQLKRAFALLFSVSQIRNFISTVAETRGYFELQQKSLQAIIQNKTKADEIFKKTLNQALDSPFRAKELITFVKQLAAYRIESNKLYDTTKRLADVSAGLGVDMQRLILAYGQVKAAAYLRGTEVRQFTEAGINLYGELQAYFKEVKGEAYTTAQIVDMISKRKVTFEDIEQIFRRLTDEGGLFYNMQHIQVETLQGKIGKLKDALDQMYNSIGMSSEGLLKGSLDVATLMVQQWEVVSEIMKRVIGIIILMKINSYRTGVTMSMAFKQPLKALALLRTNMVGFSSLLKSIKAGFTQLGVTAKAVFKTIGSSMMSLGWIWALGEIIGQIYSMFSKYSEMKELKAESAYNLNKAMYNLTQITSQYNQTLNKENLSTKENVKNIDLKRDALERLISMMNKEGFNIDIKVNTLSKEELDKTFNYLTKEYKAFSYGVNEILNSYDDGNTHWFEENLKTDLKDFQNAMGDVVLQANAFDKVIAGIQGRFGELPKEMQFLKEEMQALQSGEYDPTKLNDVYKKIQELQLKLNTEYANDKSLSGVRSELWKINEAYDEAIRNKYELLKVEFDPKKREYNFEGELAQIAKNLQNQFKQSVTNGINAGLSATEAKEKAYINISMRIDELAAKREISESGVRLLKNVGEWSLYAKVKVDKDGLSKEMKWADKYIQDFLANKDYRVNVDVNTNALNGFVEAGDKLVQEVNRLDDVAKRINRSKGGMITVDQELQDMLAGRMGGSVKVGVKFDKSVLAKEVEDVADAKYKTAVNGYGVDPKSFNRNKSNTKTLKVQRDILSEQIALLKEMQARYEKLQPMIGDEEAAKRVKAYYAESLKYVKMPQGIVNSFVPTKEGVIAAIEKIIPTISDFKKKMDAKNYVAELKIGIDNDSLKTEIDKAKTTLETAFSGLDMYNDLKKAGLGDGYIRSMFGDIPKTFEDLQGQIDRTFAGKTGRDWAKLKEEQEKKLQEKIQKYNLDTFKELTKAYKTQLTEQLKLDAWYMEEKMKIMESVSDPTLQKEYLGNLEKQYNQKTSENTWKDFKDSDFYIRMFENLESQSTVMLNAMREKLVSLRTELKNLSPEQLKEIVRQTEEIDNQLIQRNPFKGLADNFQDYVKFAKERKKLEKDYVSSKQKEDSLNATSKAQNEEVTNAKAKYDLAVKTYGANSMQAAEAKLNLATAQKKLDTTLKELVAQGLITEELAEQIRKGEESKSKFRKGFEFVSEKLQQVTAGYSDFENMMSNFGIEMPKEIAGTLSGLNQISGGIEKIMSGDVVGGALSAVAGIGNTFGSIFGFGNKDNKLQKEIEKHQEKVERLQKAYDNLKDKMDKAWDATSVIQTTDEMQKNIDSQISSYQAMIRAEEAKKKTDDSKIKEYKEQINELIKQRKELEEQKIQTLGAIGESTYKDAAQDFVDAWIDAYKESSSTIDAINGKMDDLIENMMKKQLMQRAAKKYFEPIFTMFDKMFDKNPADGELVTKEELEQFSKSYGKYLEGFDEFAKQFMNVMGYNQTGSSELSKLQQGIQSMSEETGQALESMLNSIRFFVAQQTTDISAIRALLAAGGNVAYSAESTPLLNELRAQSGILNKIYSTLSSVISPNHPKYGYGLKVFMN